MADIKPHAHLKSKGTNSDVEAGTQVHRDGAHLPSQSLGVSPGGSFSLEEATGEAEKAGGKTDLAKRGADGGATHAGFGEACTNDDSLHDSCRFGTCHNGTCCLPEYSVGDEDKPWYKACYDRSNCCQDFACRDGRCVSCDDDENYQGCSEGLECCKGFYCFDDGDDNECRPRKNPGQEDCYTYGDDKPCVGKAECVLKPGLETSSGSTDYYCCLNRGEDCHSDGECCGSLECPGPDHKCCKPAGGNDRCYSNEECCPDSVCVDTCVRKDLKAKMEAEKRERQDKMEAEKRELEAEWKADMKRVEDIWKREEVWKQEMAEAHDLFVNAVKSSPLRETYSSLNTALGVFKEDKTQAEKLVEQAKEWLGKGYAKASQTLEEALKKLDAADTISNDTKGGKLKVAGLKLHVVEKPKEEGEKAQVSLEEAKRLIDAMPVPGDGLTTDSISEAGDYVAKYMQHVNNAATSTTLEALKPALATDKMAFADRMMEARSNGGLEEK